MNSNMKMHLFGFSSVLLLSAATAFAAPEQDSAANESVGQQQKSLLEKLDSLNDAVLGLRVNGSAKAGVLTSMASSDQFSSQSPTQETQAFTDVNLILTARPSSETQVRVEARLHKDWQSAYEENNNPIIGHWFSYDGLIFDKRLAFNLGYMRVGYTPYTLYTPQPNLLQEPEIFAAARAEAMSKRNLDTTSRRLLQGLNADFHSGSLGVLDDVHAQITGARLRNIAKKNDQVFFDFDWSDRYLYGGRLGVEAYGARLGVNFVNVFDRELSFLAHDLDLGDSVILDDNKVFTGEFGFNTAKILPDLPVVLGFDAEVALSWWDANLYHSAKKSYSEYVIQKGLVPNEDGVLDSIAYVKEIQKNSNETVSENFMDDNGMAFYVEPYVKANFGDLNLQLRGRYLQNDKKFWSEMASASNFDGNTVILNANGLYSDSVYTSLVSAFGMSSLENLYYQVYNSNPLNLTNLLTSATANVLTAENDESPYMYSRVYNNYKNAHFYRNAYSADTKKRLEASEILNLMDGSMDMALPYGLATPDRKGFAVSFDGDWCSMVTLNGRFARYNWDAVDDVFLEYAVGVGIRLDELFPVLDQVLGNADNENRTLIQASYAHAEEDNYFKRKTDRIMAGVTSDNIIGPVGLQFGVETFSMEYGNHLQVSESAAITKTEEMLLRVGPRIKIAPASYLSVQYGLLTDKISFERIGVAEDGLTPVVTPDEFSIDKNVIMADVTVTF